jgi:hypothetical protein
MIETFYGNSGTPIGILIEQLGRYLVLSTLGIAVTTPALPEDQMKELWRALQRTTASTEAVVEST